MTDKNSNDTQSATEAEGQEPDTESSDTQEPDNEQAAKDAPEGTEKAPESDEKAPESDEENEDGDDKALDHDGALKAVSKLRKENASWRKKFRDLEAKMADATTPEKVEALKAEFDAQSKSLLIENVALKYDLPAELAERLSGDTREELEADAKKLVKFVTKKSGTKADDLSGGLDPSEDEGSFDPVKIAADLRKRNRNH